MPEVLDKFSCPMYGYHQGLKSKFEEGENLIFFNEINFFPFEVFWTLLESSRVKRMLRGRFWCLVCVNQTIHC